MTRHPNPLSAASRKEGDRPRLRPPSATKSIAAVAHRTAPTVRFDPPVPSPEVLPESPLQHNWKSWITQVAQTNPRPKPLRPALAAHERSPAPPAATVPPVRKSYRGGPLSRRAAPRPKSPPA